MLKDIESALISSKPSHAIKVHQTPFSLTPFSDLIFYKADAKLKAVRTINKQCMRMVKRRNSPYASFDQSRSRNMPMDSTPTLLSPLPLGPRQEWRYLDST